MFLWLLLKALSALKALFFSPRKKRTKDGAEEERLRITAELVIKRKRERKKKKEAVSTEAVIRGFGWQTK